MKYKEFGLLLLFVSSVVVCSLLFTILKYDNPIYAIAFDSTAFGDVINSQISSPDSQVTFIFSSKKGRLSGNSDAFSKGRAQTWIYEEEKLLVFLNRNFKTNSYIPCIILGILFPLILLLVIKLIPFKVPKNRVTGVCAEAAGGVGDACPTGHANHPAAQMLELFLLPGEMLCFVNRPLISDFYGDSDLNGRTDYRDWTVGGCRGGKPKDIKYA